MKNNMRTVLISLWGMALFLACNAADWPAFRGNLARTGYYPDPVGHPMGAPEWKLSLEGEIISSPVIKDGLLYVGARDSCIYAIDCRNGSVRWKTKTGGWVDGSPLVVGDSVFVGSRDSTIYVLNGYSGNIIGRIQGGVQLSSPAITSAGEILSGLGLPGGGVLACGVASISKKRADAQWSIPLPQYTYSSPAVRGVQAVIGATDGKLYGVDTGDKDTIWSLSTGGVIYLSTPAIVDTTVYFAPGDEDRNVYAVSLSTGKVLWKNDGTTLSVGPYSKTAKRKSSRTITGTELLRLTSMSPALRKKTIQRLRKQGIEFPIAARRGALGKMAASSTGEFIPVGGMKTSSVGVGPNNVYVIQKDLGYVLINDSLIDYSQQFLIQAFDKESGEFAWSFGDWLKSPQLGYCSSPVVTQNMVYFGWGEGRIYGLDAKNGDLLWADTLEGHVISSPAIAQGKLYVATMEGHLYAYDLNATASGIDFQTSTYCYPNPAKVVSKIQYFFHKPGSIEVRIYDFSERLVKVFRRSALQAQDKDSFEWDVASAANGVYFALVTAQYDDGTKDQKKLKIAVKK